MTVAFYGIPNCEQSVSYVEKMEDRIIADVRGLGAI